MTDWHKDIDIEKILFFDIETVAKHPSFSELPKFQKEEFKKRHKHLIGKNKEEEQIYLENAGFYAEFSKVIVLTIGYVHKGTLRLKTFAEKDEKKLLQDFASFYEKKLKNHFTGICGHNIAWFDLPFLGKRFLLNGLPLPDFLQEAQINDGRINSLRVYDTMKLWKFGRYKDSVSLEFLANLLELPSPKQIMHGYEVHSYYYEKDDLPKIAKYCENDVEITARVFLALTGHRELAKKLQV